MMNFTCLQTVFFRNRPGFFAFFHCISLNHVDIRSLAQSQISSIKNKVFRKIRVLSKFGVQQCVGLVFVYPLSLMPVLYMESQSQSDGRQPSWKGGAGRQLEKKGR